MANRKIYSQVGVFAGTCNSTGFHFADSSGYLVNSQFCALWNGLSGYSTNLVKSLTRINSASYSFNEARTDIKGMGNFGTVARPIITTPPVSLNISYYSHGLYNEEILGFFISSGINITPVSGFLDRTNRNPNNVDARNIFIATNEKTTDFNFLNPVVQSLNGTTSSILKDDIYVYAFGDCFLDSWKYSAEVLQFPQVETSFTCNNINYYSGGSGQTIPSVHHKDFSYRSGITYNLPPIYTGIQPTILLPGDITTTITEVLGTNYIQNLPVSFTDIKLQKFDISLNLTREPLNNLGYRIPLDRRINPPIYANLSFSAIVGDSETGSLINFVNNDTNYNIDISMKYSHQPVTGVGIDFQFLNAKFNNINVSESIDQKRMCNFSFTSELNPASTTQGFFISGQLSSGSYNTPLSNSPPTNFILSGTGTSYVSILLNWTPSFSSSSAVTYSLYRDTGINFVPGLSNLIVSNLSTLSYIDIPTTSGYGTTYYYYAKASDNYGLFTFSNEASGTTLIPPPPLLLSLNPSGHLANSQFNLNLLGANFTNLGNEFLSISGYGLSSGTGLIFMDTGHLTRPNLSMTSGIYSLTYVNNYGFSTLLSGLRICQPPIISGFNPTSAQFSGYTGFQNFTIDLTGGYFTNNGNEIVAIQNSIGTTFTGQTTYINSNHVSASFSGSNKYTQGNYSGYYINNCSEAFFSGLLLTQLGFIVSSWSPLSISQTSPDDQSTIVIRGSGFKTFNTFSVPFVSDSPSVIYYVSEIFGPAGVNTIVSGLEAPGSQIQELLIVSDNLIIGVPVASGGGGAFGGFLGLNDLYYSPDNGTSFLYNLNITINVTP